METFSKIKTSEVKKGDIFDTGNSRYKAYTDAYQKNGVWSVDIDAKGEYTYGWSSRDQEIKVLRIVNQES